MFVTPVGGLIEFSGQHLHSKRAQQHRPDEVLIDFRTVHIDDLEARRSAPNIDVSCTGSSIRDFIRASDFAPVPDEIVHLFDDGTEHRGDVLYVDNRRDALAIAANEDA